MEGSYNRVWSSRSEVPAPEYLFFIDILMNTIRNEIASCSEKAYTSLPLSDAGTLLFFTNMQDILNFAKEVFLFSFSQKCRLCVFEGSEVCLSVDFVANISLSRGCHK